MFSNMKFDNCDVEIYGLAFKSANTCDDGLEYALSFRYLSILRFSLNNWTRIIVTIVLLSISPIVVSLALVSIVFVALCTCSLCCICLQIFCNFQLSIIYGKWGSHFVSIGILSCYQLTRVLKCQAIDKQ